MSIAKECLKAKPVAPGIFYLQTILSNLCFIGEPGGEWFLWMRVSQVPQTPFVMQQESYMALDIPRRLSS